jgi:hypothetical protein
MNTRDNIAIRKSSFSPADQEMLLEETILEWRALGPAAAWNAIYDMLDWWFTARGLDPKTQRVDRTHIEIRTVPWLVDNSEGTVDPRAGRGSLFVAQPVRHSPIDSQSAAIHFSEESHSARQGDATGGATG